MIMQNYAAMGVITITWFLIGFSLCFGKSVGGVIGNPATFAAFNNVGGEPLKHDDSGALVDDIPGLVFAGYQGMFAVSRPLDRMPAAAAAASAADSCRRRARR